MVFAALLVMLCCCHAQRAGAQVACSTSGPTFAFGTIDPSSGNSYSTSGSMAIACVNPGSSTVTVSACLSIGTGSGGLTPSNRVLTAGGSSRIPIQITGDSKHPSQIGNNSAYTMDGPFSFTLAPSQGAAAIIPMIVTIPTIGTPPGGGSYSSNFSGADALLYYTTATSPSTCAAATGFETNSSAGFAVTATVPTVCSVSATSLAFPAGSVLNTVKDATATITVTCNASLPVTIALDNGATGTGPTLRKMTSGANAIRYGIFRNAARTLAWGSTSGTDTASSSGSATLVAYGRVPVQTSPVAGSYSDVINILISY